MSFICNDCYGNPDFKTKYNKEVHQGQCHINVTECDSGIPRRMVRQPDDLFYCPTCSIGCRISNFIRAHVSRCVKPAGSAVGMATQMGGFSTSEEALADRKRISASPSPGPSLAPPPSKPYSRPVKPIVTDEERRRKREEEEDRLDRKREVALEFARNLKQEKEEVKEKEKERLRKWERENVFAAVAAAPLPMFKKKKV